LMNTLALSLLGLAFSSSVIQLPEQIAGKDLSDLLRRWPREYARWIMADAESDRYIKVDFFIMRYGRLFMGVPANHLFPSSEPAGISASIPLRKCTAGDYTLRVRVTDEVTGERAETEANFIVRESSPNASR
ncbi:MAG: hypothetical protein V3V11_02360, partial [Vicinamibacteria bacterium]